MRRDATVRRWAAAALACVLALLWHARALASPRLEVQAAPLFGVESPAGGGWSTIWVRLENTGAAPLTGTVELSTTFFGFTSRAQTTTTPFSVAARQSVTLQIPSHQHLSQPARKTVTVRDPDGNALRELAVSDPHGSEPFLLDLHVPSRLGAALGGSTVPLDSSIGPMPSPVATAALAVGTPRIDPASGDPVLPERAAGYAPVTLVLSTSERLVKLSAVELQALGDWVLSGGALALVVTRPEDLKAPPVVSLLGGPVRPTAPHPALGSERVFLRAPPSEQDQATRAPSAAPPSLETQRVAPRPSTLAQAMGFEGANARPSPWGASASYGLGEVHLLAFDPGSARVLEDDWVRLSMIDLVRHALGRTNAVALPHAELPPDSMGTDAVRRQLDPNETARWTIVVSALLLLAYALVAGPLNFLFAARKGRPLKALLYLPLYAAGAAAIIVILGTLGRGFEGKVRRLTLVEAGAGMSRAAAARFRGFFASSADALVVWVEERGNLLDVAGDPSEGGRVLSFDRRGTRLEEFRTRPWQVLVVREQGFVGLGGGVAVGATPSGDIVVHNRTAKDLLGVVIKAPGKLPVFIDRIADGQRALASAGRALPGSFGPTYPQQRFSPLGSGDLAPAFEAEVPGLGAAWMAVEAMANHGTDFWPRDVPVVLAQLGDSGGGARDSGMRVESDRILLRVVGYGGTL